MKEQRRSGQAVAQSALFGIAAIGAATLIGIAPVMAQAPAAPPAVTPVKRVTTTTKQKTGRDGKPLGATTTKTVEAVTIIEPEKVTSPHFTPAAFWPLTYVSGDAPIPGKEDEHDRSAAYVKALAESMNAVYGEGSVKPLGTGLALYGDHVAQMQHDLATQMDTPWAQVRIDILSIQLNTRGGRTKGQEEMDVIRAGATLVREAISRFQAELAGFVASEDNAGRMKMGTKLETHLGKPTLPSNKNRPLQVRQARVLSPYETLIYLAYCDRTVSKEPNLAQRLTNHCAGYLTWLTFNETRLQKLEKDAPPEEQKGYQALLALVTRLKMAARQPLYQTTDALVEGRADGDSEAVEAFLEAYENSEIAASKKDEKGSDKIGPDLVFRAATVNALLRLHIERYQSDLDEMFYNPLRQWATQRVRKARGSGLNVVGRTAVNVTSRRPAAVTAKFEASLPTTPNPRLTTGLLGSVGDTQEAAKPVVGGLTGLEGLLLASVLNAPQAEYTTLAPGISLGARPTVLPGESLVRLPFRLSSTLQVTRPDAKQEGTTPYAPLSQVKSATVETDLEVPAYSVFYVATSGVDHTSLGGPEWRIGPLEYLPLIGQLFRGPRRTVTTHQESMVIGSVVVIPRALDLVRPPRLPRNVAEESSVSASAPNANSGAGKSVAPATSSSERQQ